MALSAWRPVFLALGWLSLGLGFVGVFLPVLPTTPFVLLAAFFFSKSSERMHRWLLAHRVFGPLVRDWQSHGVIRPKAKWLATAMMVPLFGYTLFFVTVPKPWIIKSVVGACGLAVLAFVWSRPSRPPH
jgi:uncharacterized protein